MVSWRKLRTISTTSHHHPEVSSLACFGLTLQITLMYLGTVAKRTLDGAPSWEWLPPALTAVHYVIRDAFAIRDYALVEWLRSQPLWMTQGMTAHSMVAESSAVLWFLLPNNYIRYYGFWMLFTLHLGLLLVTRLPNWQFMAMIASVLWIPTCVWNKSSAVDRSSNNNYKKTDDETTRSNEDEETMTTNTAMTHPPSKLQRIWTKFLLVYMLYNFMGERGWIAKHDGGDIGEFFRISQYWVMYSSPPKSSVKATILGYKNDISDNEEWVDVIQGLRTNNWQWQWQSQSEENNNIDLQTVISPRWERALDQWGRSKDQVRAKYLLQRLCSHHIPNDIERLELIWTNYKIVPPGETEGRRWIPYPTNPKIITPVSCQRQEGWQV
jgi:hypothetical protein